MDGTECTHCPMCDPEDYITVVDYSFLRAMRDIYENLKEVAPDRVAPYWGSRINDLIEETLRIGSRKSKN